MEIKKKMNDGMKEIYHKYGKDMMLAHSQLLNLEKRYKCRVAGDNKIIQDKILMIVDEVINDN